VPNWVYEPAFSNRGGNGGGGSYGAGGWTDGAANSQQRNSGAQPTTRQERNTQSTRPDDRSDADLDVDGAQDQVKADLNLQDQGTIVAASAAAGLGAGMVYGMTSATGVAVLDLTIAYGLIGSQLGIVAGIGILLWYSIDFDARDSEEYTLNPYEQILMQP
ncbi:MAG: hypothetical protein OXQ89_23095, partial [Rhodospirillaceae bacterium]|nr:hypothetical protein [Rhodospirillaceae bacterium]